MWNVFKTFFLNNFVDIVRPGEKNLKQTDPKKFAFTSINISL